MKLHKLLCRSKCSCRNPAEGFDKVCNETMERLMRLVVAQGETIHTQIRRMTERDQQIENYEHQMHLLRVQSLGSDYLLHSYLRDPQELPTLPKENRPNEDLTCEEKSNDSGVITEEAIDTECLGSPNERLSTSKQSDNIEDVEDTRARTFLLDKLDVVLNRLLEHEEALSKLEDSLENTTLSELSQMQDDINNVNKMHAETVSIARQNEQQLRELDMVLYQRRMTLETLIEEDTRYEQEALALQAHLDFIIHLPPTAFILPDEDQFEPQILSSNTNKNAPSSSKVATSTSKQTVSVPNFPNFSVINNESLPKSNELKDKIQNLNSTFEKYSPPIIQNDQKNLKCPLRLNNNNKPLKETSCPPPLPSSSPPPLDADDDKDSGQTSSLCVSSRSSTSSETSRCEISPCQRTSSTSKVTTSSIKSGESPKDNDSTDSNSDTGLSSLHSSSDEGAYVLDTLV